MDKSIDFSKPIPPYGQNVILVALMLAIYLGCNPIYIIGADHTWWRWTSQTNNEKKIIPHFYEKNLKTPKNNVSNNSIQKTLSTDWYRTTVFVQRYQYVKIFHYAMDIGIEIYNATAGGELDIFPRISYETLFPEGYDAFTEANILRSIPNISKKLGNIALKLINENEFEAAFTVVDSALKHNSNKPDRCLGLNYLKALCLSALGYIPEAIKEARNDFQINPKNRDNSLSLLNSLNDK